MPRPRAVFLDAGGTLIHADRPFLLGLLEAHGRRRSAADLIAAEQAARESVGSVVRSTSPGDDASRAFVYWRRVLEALGCGEAEVNSIGGSILERHARGRLWCFVEPGTREALLALRAHGLILGVVSNSDGRVADFLENAGLADLFDFVVDSGRVGVEKPDPRIFGFACDAAAVSPDEAVHVGDILEIDVVGARAAGIAAVLLAPEGAYAPVDVTRIHAFTELPALLGVALPRAGGVHAG